MFKNAMNGLQYRFDAKGNTTRIDVNFEGHDDNRDNYINGSVNVTTEDLDEGVTLDDLNRKKIQDIAHKKLVKLVSATGE